MAACRNRWRLLVGWLKNVFRRVGVLRLAMLLLRMLYYVAKIFDCTR